MINPPWILNLNREQIVEGQDNKFILKQVKDWLKKGKPPLTMKDLDRKLQGNTKPWEQLSLEQNG